MKREDIFWHIQGYDSLTKIYDQKVKAGYFSQYKIQDLIKALAATAGQLTFDKILGAYAKRKTKVANDLLQVDKEGPYPEFRCGINPHFIARIVDEKGMSISQKRSAVDDCHD